MIIDAVETEGESESDDEEQSSHVTHGAGLHNISGLIRNCLRWFDVHQHNVCYISMENNWLYW